MAKTPAVKDPLAVDIGNRIRLFREEHQILQKDFADGAGIPRSRLCQYENGEELPGLRAVTRIALFMDHSVDWLLYGRENDGTMRAEPVVRETILALERATPHVRNAVIEIATAMIRQDLDDKKVQKSGG
ncbi:MAG TPA: helix-turn-helix domain-containing protein, partial [Thermoanaerobaculia bacterium]